MPTHIPLRKDEDWLIGVVLDKFRQFRRPTTGDDDMMTVITAFRVIKLLHILDESAQNPFHRRIKPIAHKTVRLHKHYVKDAGQIRFGFAGGGGFRRDATSAATATPAAAGG